MMAGSVGQISRMPFRNRRHGSVIDDALLEADQVPMLRLKPFILRTRESLAGAIPRIPDGQTIAPTPPVAQAAS